MYKNYPEYTGEYWTGAFASFNLPSIYQGCAEGTCPPTLSAIYKTVQAQKQTKSRIGTCWDLFDFSATVRQFDVLSDTISGCKPINSRYPYAKCDFDNNKNYEVPQTGSCGGKDWGLGWYIKLGSYVKEYSHDSKGKTELWSSYDKRMSGKLKVVCNNFPQYWKDNGFPWNFAVDEDGFVYELQN